jgi:hypothetical protein
MTARLCLALVRLAAIQVRSGLVAAEIAVMGFHQMRDMPTATDVDPPPSISDAELEPQHRF